MKRSTKRWKWCIGFAVAIVAVILIYLWMTFCPPMYYLTFMGTTRELPTRLVRPVFRKITGWDLPSKADKSRAIFTGGREPSIFVRFQTNPAGVLYIREQLIKRDVDSEPFSGIPRFPIVSQKQELLGIDILDQRAIESGLRLWHLSLIGVGYDVVIDTQHNNVYIRAWRN